MRNAPGAVQLVKHRSLPVTVFGRGIGFGGRQVDASCMKGCCNLFRQSRQPAALADVADRLAEARGNRLNSCALLDQRVEGRCLVERVHVGAVKILLKADDTGQIEIGPDLNVGALVGGLQPFCDVAPIPLQTPPPCEHQILAVIRTRMRQDLVDLGLQQRCRELRDGGITLVALGRPGV